MKFVILGLLSFFDANPTVMQRLHAERLCKAANQALPEMRMVAQAHRVCVDVAMSSLKAGFTALDTAYILAASYNETRFRRGLRGRQGEIGPLQIKPRFWCPKRSEEGCDPVDHGVKALATLYNSKRYGDGDWTTTLAMFNGGHVAPDLRYGDKVYNLGRRVIRALATLRSGGA